MEMSVTIPQNDTERTTSEMLAKSAKIVDRRGVNASELDVWLEKAEAMGELKRITAEVSPDLEAAHITYLVGLTKSPALLFENIAGCKRIWSHPFRSLRFQEGEGTRHPRAVRVASRHPRAKVIASGQHYCIYMGARGLEGCRHILSLLDQVWKVPLPPRHEKRWGFPLNVE
jgi:3-polyprenyl-4-hydroxybenzoate decarboxylase